MVGKIALGWSSVVVRCERGRICQGEEYGIGKKKKWKRDGKVCKGWGIMGDISCRMLWRVLYKGVREGKDVKKKKNW